MTKLTPIERKIIQRMICKEAGSASPLLDQLDSAEFDVRNMTGTGYYVMFQNAKAASDVGDMNSELSAGHATSLKPPRDLVGFTLFIRRGVLSSFEGYTFGDVSWPEEPLEDWLVVESRTPQKVG